MKIEWHHCMLSKKEVQMTNLKLNLKYTGIEESKMMEYAKQVESIHKELHKKANDKKEFVRMD